MAPKIGDVVWARTTGFPFWPAKVIPEEMAAESVRALKKDGQLLVKYFGDTRSGWFFPKDLFDFEERKEKIAKEKVKSSLKARLAGCVQLAQAHLDEMKACRERGDEPSLDIFTWRLVSSRGELRPGRGARAGGGGGGGVKRKRKEEDKSTTEEEEGKRDGSSGEEAAEAEAKEGSEEEGRKERYDPGELRARPRSYRTTPRASPTPPSERSTPAAKRARLAPPASSAAKRAAAAALVAGALARHTGGRRGRGPSAAASPAEAGPSKRARAAKPAEGSPPASQEAAPSPSKPGPRAAVRKSAAGSAAAQARWSKGGKKGPGRAKGPPAEGPPRDPSLPDVDDVAVESEDEAGFVEVATAVEELADGGHLRPEEAAQLRTLCLSLSSKLLEGYRVATATELPFSKKARFLRAYREKLCKL